MRLQEKVTLITGAGSGIGKAIALLFAREGAQVVATDINDDAVRTTAKEIQSSNGRAIAVAGDTTKSQDVQHLLREAVQAFGKVNVVVNCAGISHIEDTGILNVPEDVWDRVIEVNLKGYFLVCKYAIPEMIKAGGGSIINISSGAARIVMGRGGGSTAYSVSKAGVNCLTMAIAAQHAANDIRANVIMPGAMDTPMLQISRTKLGEGILAAGVGKPDKLAYVALFLASDESAYVTGQEIYVAVLHP